MFHREPTNKTVNVKVHTSNCRASSFCLRTLYFCSRCDNLLPNLCRIVSGERPMRKYSNSGFLFSGVGAISS